MASPRCAIPVASSDLILLLRYGYAPGEENGRRLTYLGANFWRIEGEYQHRDVTDQNAAP